MNKIIDAINALRITVNNALDGKEEFKPVSRPTTAFDEAVKKRVDAYEKRDNDETLALFGF